MNESYMEMELMLNWRDRTVNMYILMSGAKSDLTLSTRRLGPEITSKEQTMLRTHATTS